MGFQLSSGAIKKPLDQLKMTVDIWYQIKEHLRGLPCHKYNQPIQLI